MLSICIPTYNRCHILDETLEKLFNNPDFDNNIIEVIVSDNCSNDSTKAVVSKYPLVSYFCNDTNIGFSNLTTVLSYARGKYVKLFNDTFSFKPNMLKQLLNRIILHENDNINLFFYPNFLHNQNVSRKVKSVSSFLYECSFNTTWTASIGFWKRDFDKITNPNRYAPLHFPHLEWMYSMVRDGKVTMIYFEDFYNVAIPNKKGGYNVFKTFADDYLEIIKKQRINIFIYELEKYRLCRYFLYPWLQTLLLRERTNYSYDTNKSFSLIFKKYWYEPYLYPMLLMFLFKKWVK